MAFFLLVLQGPRGYKGINGPVGIPGPPVSTHLSTPRYPKRQYKSRNGYSMNTTFVGRVKKALRDHPEMQETRETK